MLQFNRRQSIGAEWPEWDQVEAPPITTFSKVKETTLSTHTLHFHSYENAQHWDGLLQFNPEGTRVETFYYFGPSTHRDLDLDFFLDCGLMDLEQEALSMIAKGKEQLTKHVLRKNEWVQIPNGESEKEGEGYITVHFLPATPK